MYIGTGGDEASIWAGDLVSSYLKYCEDQQWKVMPISETQGEMGGYKTCCIQVTGEYVYSKLKYEVSYHYYCLYYYILVIVIVVCVWICV